MMTDEAVAELELRYYYEDTDRHGNVRRYFRKRGLPKIRLRSDPEKDPEAFHREFAAALSGATSPQLSRPKRAISPIGSLRWLVDEYYRSADFRKNLAKSTQGVRRNILEVLCNEKAAENDPTLLGSLPFAIPADHIVVLRDRKSDLPESANGRVKTLRGLFDWAVTAKHIKINPAKVVPYIKSGNPNGYHTWTMAEVEQFKVRHPLGTNAHLAMHLILLLGQRRSDIVQFGKQHIRKAEHIPEKLRVLHSGRWIHFTQFKGRDRHPMTLTIPILPELESVIDGSPCGDMTFLVNSHGRPYSAASFGNWFRERCDDAGLKHCSSHGLRKAGATIAAENGASAHTLKAIFGWTTLKQAELYTRKAEQTVLAGAGMSLLIGAKNEQM